MPLGEVACLKPPAAAASDERTREVAGERDDPERRLRRSVQRRGDEQEDDRDERARGEARDRGEEVAVASPGDGVEREVRDTHDRVRAREDERVVAEHVRDGERRHEHRDHGAEHHDPDLALLGIDGVRQPGVGGPRPPEDAEHDEALREPGPGRVAADQRGDLREREDEDEVEEELERSDTLLAGLLARLDAQRPTS